MDMNMEIKYLVNSMLFSFLGTAFLVVSFFVFDKLTPYNLWKEICEQKNVALGIVVGSIAIGISLIIAAAIQG